MNPTFDSAFRILHSAFHSTVGVRRDFVEAENSTGVHAPEEAQRILAESIDDARQGQLALRAPQDGGK